MIPSLWSAPNVTFALALTLGNLILWLYVAPAAVRAMKCRDADGAERDYEALTPSWHAEHSKPDEITGLAKVEADALALLRYHHKYGKRMTRRRRPRDWSQDDWNKAYGAAKSAGCYDDADELTVDLNDWQTVLDMVQDWRMTQAELDRLGNFVSAR